MSKPRQFAADMPAEAELLDGQRWRAHQDRT